MRARHKKRAAAVARTQELLARRAQDVTGAQPLQDTNDNTVYSGSYSSSSFGVRVSTPFFGSGFNACIGARRCPVPFRPGRFALRGLRRPVPPRPRSAQPMSL